MTESLPNALRQNSLKVNDYAVTHGIRIRQVPLTSITVFWSAVDRALIIAAELPERERTEAIAHGIAHIEMSESEEVLSAYAGITPRAVVEGRVHTAVARMLIPAGLLVEALSMSDDLRVVSGLLDVSEFLLHWRLEHLTQEDLAVLPAELLNRTGWVPGMGPGYPHSCTWPVHTGDDLLVAMHN